MGKYVHSNRNSLRTGALENSGFNKMQLRKYCNPILLFSKNLGRNLETMLLGGRGGIAPSELGKVWRSLERRSLNSVKRFRMRNEEPRKVSTVIFHTTNAPTPILRSFITTWSSIYTLFAQQNLLLVSSPSSLSFNVIAPGDTDSTEIFEKDR